MFLSALRRTCCGVYLCQPILKRLRKQPIGLIYDLHIAFIQVGIFKAYPGMH